MGDPLFNLVVATLATALLNLATTIIGHCVTLYTSWRDRKWQAEDAEKKAALVMAASKKDAEGMIRATRGRARRYKPLSTPTQKRKVK